MPHTSVIQGADLWLAVACGLGLLLLGVGVGYLISHHLKKVVQQRLEEEVEARVLRRLAEEERAQRISFLEEKDNWYRLRSEQEHKLGPVLRGLIRLGTDLNMKLRYEAGYLFGLTSATPDGEIKWLLEIEIPL